MDNGVFFLVEKVYFQRLFLDKVLTKDLIYWTLNTHILFILSNMAIRPRAKDIHSKNTQDFQS